MWIQNLRGKIKDYVIYIYISCVYFRENLVISDFSRTLDLVLKWLWFYKLLTTGVEVVFIMVP